MQPHDFVIRDATPADYPRINDIYNWTIVDNHVSFDTEPWDLARRTAWMESRGPDLDCLVGEVDGTIIGVTYSSYYRPKHAYRSTKETTIVLDIDQLGRGYGSALLLALLDRLDTEGTHMAVAIIALPNDGSVALHLKLGYSIVGTLTDAGMKYGSYYDTMILQRSF